MSSPKKREILATGKSLFFKHGFKRVTIEEICEAADVSKMTYYKYFSNKMDLVKKIMKDTMEEAVAEYKSIMKSDISFTKKIELQIEMKRKGTAEISKEFMDDLLIHGEPEMMKYMQESTQKIMAIIQTDYRMAQQKGDIRKDIKPEFIIYFLNHVYEMLKDEYLISMYKDPGELAMELIQFFFYGIANRNEAIK